MFWFVVYASVAFSVVVIAGTVARHVRKTYADDPTQWVPAAFLAGALWPIVLIALAELGIAFVMAKAPSILGSIQRLTRAP